MSSQEQTANSFKQKWTNANNFFLDTTTSDTSDINKWILNRNGFDTTDEFSNWIGSKTRILDAGCGNGRVSLLISKFMNQVSSLIGIDLVAHEIAAKNLEGVPRCSFLFGDLLGDLETLGKFDLIYCQEVLHHTSNPRMAFRNLVTLLSPGGEIAIYVYKKKAVLREYSDDFIREQISNLTYEESRTVIGEITNFAKEMSKLDNKISIPALNVLGIKEQSLTLQRFIYNNVFKNFWSDELSYEENFSINFDWYHPDLCSRHTLEEVINWFKEENLLLLHTEEDDFGITARGLRNI
jgi:SAM-dependent methyltransferase